MSDPFLEQVQAKMKDANRQEYMRLMMEADPAKAGRVAEVAKSLGLSDGAVAADYAAYATIRGQYVPAPTAAENAVAAEEARQIKIARFKSQGMTDGQAIYAADTKIPGEDGKVPAAVPFAGLTDGQTAYARSLKMPA